MCRTPEELAAPVDEAEALSFRVPLGRGGTELGGIGAARIYLPPMNPNGGGPVGGPQGRPQGDPMGGPQQQMQGLPQGGSQDDVLKMLAEAQARAAKVSVAADGTVGRV